MADKASLSYGNLAVGHASRTNHEQLAWFPPLAQSMADNDKRCSAVLGVSPTRALHQDN
ncbi:hypothetical protein [Moorena producens]|uniref:hypothetical protein n=1 Tax=Moorena producens TaxID=1155739 RepID=UPI003C735076